MPSYYKDIEGTIPAKDGDRVALIVNDQTDESLVQPRSAYQPIYREILDGVILCGDQYMVGGGFGE